jgi:hypothetical protein
MNGESKMSRIKRFDQYPTEFWDVLESILAGSPVEIFSETTKPLVALRTALYYYAKAIRETPPEVVAKAIERIQGIDDFETAQRMAIRAYAASCDMYVTLRAGPNGGHILRIGSRGRDSPLAKLLKESLLGSKPAAQPPEGARPAGSPKLDEAAQRSAERLLEILKGK